MKMLRMITMTLVLLISVSVIPAFAVIPIDLNTWTQQGNPANGNWTVTGGGNTVFQSINGNPTFFVSPDNFINTTINGSFQVKITGDDDFIGFVFGYNRPIGNENVYDFLLFDWKQGDQSFGGAFANEGFTLSRVNGTITDFIPGFWGHSNSTGFTVLASDYSSTNGWADNTLYEFDLFYTSTQIKIAIDGNEIFNVNGAFPDGKFGFYNYSQPSVEYQGFTEEVLPPDTGGAVIPEPSSMILMGLGLLGFGVTRRFKK